VNPLPNIKSAIKRVNVTETKNLRNRMIKSNIRTSVKKLENAAQAGDNQAAEAQLRAAVSTLDKAAAKGVMHKNTVNRQKARMARIAAKVSE
jgi:small subunit ribosomal protein S20